jgi:hypothetical protein
MSAGTLLRAAVALALSWRLVASLAGAAMELCGPDRYGRFLARRFADVDEPLEERWRRSLGFTDRIVRAVLENVPDEAILALAGSESRRNRLTAQALGAIAWPRRIVDAAGLTTEELERGSVGGWPLAILTLGEAATFPSPERWRRVHEHRTFAIWLPSGAGR